MDGHLDQIPTLDMLLIIGHLDQIPTLDILLIKTYFVKVCARKENTKYSMFQGLLGHSFLVVLSYGISVSHHQQAHIRTRSN